MGQVAASISTVYLDQKLDRLSEEASSAERSHNDRIRAAKIVELQVVARRTVAENLRLENFKRQDAILKVTRRVGRLSTRVQRIGIFLEALNICTLAVHVALSMMA